MTRRASTSRIVPESFWLTLTGTTLQVAMTVAILAASASLFAVSVGDPEAAALAGLAGVSAILVGLALTRAFEHARVDGLPVVEQPRPSVDAR